METQSLSIIVIDDELDQVDMTVMLLQSRGHRAVGSTDGLQAVTLVTDEDAAVVVLDFMMNGVNGGDVCRAIRADSRTRDVRIVLLSGTSEVEIRRSCTQYDMYVSKPPTSQALFRAVEALQASLQFDRPTGPEQFSKPPNPC